MTRRTAAVKDARMVYQCRMTNGDKDAAEAQRQARLAAALRANLLKRKLRERAADAPAPPPASED